MSGLTAFTCHRDKEIVTEVSTEFHVSEGLRGLLQDTVCVVPTL